MTPGEQLHQQRLAQLAQNIRWRNQAIVMFAVATVLVVLCYVMNWSLMMILLLFPWYWILQQCRHYQQEAVYDWQFMHLMHPRFRDVDSVFRIPVPHSFEPLEFPPGFWADNKPAKKKNRKTR